MKNIVITGSTRGISKFFVPAMLRNKKNDKQISWLTNGKAAWRFMTAGFRKNKLI